MIRFVTPLLTAVMLLALPASAIEITEVTSPKGIKAWLAEDDSIPFMSLSIMFRGGTSLDEEGKAGAVTLMASLLEEGAGNRNATQFAEAAEELGARFGFDAGKDVLGISAQMLTEHRDASANLLRDVLVAPRFEEDAIERVRAQLLSVIRSEATSPEAIAGKTLNALIWGDHPYAASGNGTIESVSALTADDLRLHKDRTMALDRVIVSAAGDISPEALGKMLDKLLGDLPATATAPLPAQAEYADKGGLTVIDWDSPQTILRFSAPAIPTGDPDYFAAFIVNHILGGGGFSSHLMSEIREKRGLTYGISTSLLNLVAGDAWMGGMASANDKTAEAVTLIRQVWDRTAEGITEQELQTAKTYLTGEYPLRFDGNGKIAAILGGMQLMEMPADYVNTRNSQIEAVTLADVNRVAGKLLDSKSLRFVLVGRPSGLE